MKSQIKTVALSTIFSIIGLCCTLSSASAKSNSAQFSQDLSNVTYMFAFPTLTSEGGTNESPSLLPDNSSPKLNSCKATTKNEYFEMAVIFNDKLQQFISFFSSDEVHILNTTQDNQLTKLD